MKKFVMNRAWEIARKAAVRFGGKVTQYISEALKLAWAAVKNNKFGFLELARKNGQFYFIVDHTAELTVREVREQRNGRTGKPETKREDIAYKVGMNNHTNREARLYSVSLSSHKRIIEFVCGGEKAVLEMQGGKIAYNA